MAAVYSAYAAGAIICGWLPNKRLILWSAGSRWSYLRWHVQQCFCSQPVPASGQCMDDRADTAAAILAAIMGE